MAQSILVFDFGTNEEAAQQARHKVEAWKQGFRLGNKLQLKFERKEIDEKAPVAEAENPAAKATDAKSASAGAKNRKAKVAGKAQDEEAKPADGRIRVLIRLAFSDHEKLSHQRWLDRIPAEEPFRSAGSETVRTGEPDFGKTTELFESLD
jgi:hypothetical protein